MVEVGMVFPTTKDGDVEVVSVTGNDIRVRFVVSGNVKDVVKCNLLKKMVADMEHRKAVANDHITKKRLENEIKATQSELKRNAAALRKSELKLKAEVSKHEKMLQKEADRKSKMSAKLAKPVSRNRKRRKSGEDIASQALLKLQKNADAKELRDRVGFYSKVLLNDFRDSYGKHGRMITVDGKSFSTRSSMVWQGILQRCRVGGSFQNKFKHYIGATVCDEWREDFQSFAEWYTKQVGYDLGWDVDKDALSGERHYSPSTCLLLPRCVNLMFSEHYRGHSLSDATKLDGIPRWRAKDGTFFTCLEQAIKHQQSIKISHIEVLRNEYVPIGVPNTVFDKAVNFIKI